MDSMGFSGVLVLAFVMEVIDSGLGMGFGTVLSPLLIAFGYAPTLVVPSLLFSQAVGGFTASIFHHRHRNADFKPQTEHLNGISKMNGKDAAKSLSRTFTKDTKVMLSITVLGVLATIIGALFAVQVPKWLLKAYIGGLVLVVGVLMLGSRTFTFSWRKMMGVGAVASFNKGISGGGFGPLVTGGQVVAGNGEKCSIGCTTLSEAPICITGFAVYLMANSMTTYDLLIPLSIGALLAGPIGPAVTKRLDGGKLKVVIALLIIAEGAWTLADLVLK